MAWTGNKTREFPIEPPLFPWSLVVFTPHGKLLATAGTNLTESDFLPCGTSAAANGCRGIMALPPLPLYLWDLEKARLIELLTGELRGEFVGYFESPELGALGSVAFSCDGRRLATSGTAWDQERSIHVHDLATGRESTSFVGQRYRGAQVAFSPDGRKLATAGGDTTVLLWEVNCK